MLVCTFLCARRARDRGCSAHPAFPAPSDWRGRELPANLGRNVPRECEPYPRRPGHEPGPITTGRSFAEGLCYRASMERSRGMGPPMRNCASELKAGTTKGKRRRATPQLNAFRSFWAISSSAGLCFTMRLVRFRPDMTPAASLPRWLSAMKLSKIGSSSLQNIRL